MARTDQRDDLRLAETCIYTIVSHERLADAIAGGRLLSEGKRWIRGRELWQEALGEGRRMAVVFADAASCSELIAWSTIDDISVDASGTRFRFESVYDLAGRRQQELKVLSTGLPIAEGYIRPYALCLTPDFLQKPSAKQPWRFSPQAVEDQKDGASEDAHEGVLRLEQHKRRERDSRIVELAKERHAQRNGGALPCEICGFDFAAVYGPSGAGFIEAHHRTPLSDAPETGVKSSVEDFALVCANCHRILHRGATPPSIQKVEGWLDRSSKRGRHG